MKNNLAIFILCAILFSCNAQERKGEKNKNESVITNNTSKMATEKFDIEKFAKNKINGEYIFELEDGTEVRQFGGDNNYVEYKYPPAPNLIATYKEFYYPSGKLKTIKKIFPNNFIRLSMEYNEEGKLIKQTDYDEPFKFSFEELQGLLKKRKEQIDLLDQNTLIGRAIDGTDWKGKTDKGPTWYISWKEIPMRRETLKINGITGELIEKGHYDHLDN